MDYFLKTPTWIKKLIAPELLFSHPDPSPPLDLSRKNEKRSFSKLVNPVQKPVMNGPFFFKYTTQRALPMV
jgi:hypothetical protein